MRSSVVVPFVILAASVLLGGCSDKKPIYLGCGDSAKKLVGDPGTSFKVHCPGMCGTQGSLYGTDLYTDDSSICKAGMHAGEIDASGGEFSVTIKEGADAYDGSTRNGIQSSSWKKWNRSFKVD